MSVVWKTPLSKSVKMLLLALADAANDDGYCWPSRANLSMKTGDSLRTIDRSIRWLVDHGYISVKGEKRANGSKTSSLYRVLLESSQNDARGRVKMTPGVESKSRQNVSTPRDKMTPGVETKCLLLYEPKDLTIKECAPKTTGTLPADKIKKQNHTWFLKWWCFAFATITGEKYVITAKDAAIIKRLSGSLSLEDLVTRACAYLDMPSAQRFPQGAPTLGGLTSSINLLAGKFSPDDENRFFDKGLIPDFDVPLHSFTPWEVARNAA